MARVIKTLYSGAAPMSPEAASGYVCPVGKYAKVIVSHCKDVNISANGITIVPAGDGITGNTAWGVVRAFKNSESLSDNDISHQQITPTFYIGSGNGFGISGAGGTPGWSIIIIEEDATAA